MKRSKKPFSILFNTILVVGLALTTAQATAGAKDKSLRGNNGHETLGDIEDLAGEGVNPAFQNSRGAQPQQDRLITLYPRDPMFGGRRNPRKLADLNEMIRDQKPRLYNRLDNFRLQSVTVIGRSASRRFSTSSISLQINGRHQDQAVIDQGRRHRPESAHLYAHRGRQSRGSSWNLEFQGRTEVQAIEIQLKRRQNNGGGGGHGRLGVSLGGAQEVENFRLDRDTFRARGGAVRGDQITVQATRGKVKIVEVTVVFANGRKRTLGGMNGNLDAGAGRRSLITHRLGNLRNVASVTVKARSREIRFPEAKINVFVK